MLWEGILFGEEVLSWEIKDVVSFIFRFFVELLFVVSYREGGNESSVRVSFREGS